MPNALIPSLKAWDLHVVPGYRMDPATGMEDLTWRAEFAERWYPAVKAWRADTQIRYWADAPFRAYIDHLCATDPTFFTTLWLEVEEPRAMEHVVATGTDLLLPAPEFDPYDLGDAYEPYQTIHPFIPYAYQVETMWEFARTILHPRLRSKQRNVLWDKARGCGLTYAILAVIYWGWLFKTGLRGTVLTEKWDKAEKAHSLNTLFGKLDLYFRSTPDTYIPPGFKEAGEKGADRQQGMLHNPKNGAIISTEPTTVSSTRGGREAYVAIDECAFHEHLDETWATVIGTTLHLFGWSTASNQFGRQWATKLDEGRKDGGTTTNVVTIDWFEHPHQDETWKRETRARFSAAGLAEQFDVEYLRNADAGSGQLVYFNQVQHVPNTEAWYEPQRPLYVSVDPGIEDATAFVFWQVHWPEGKKRVRWLDSYEMAKLPVEFHAHVLTGIEPIEGDPAWMLWREGFFGPVEQYFMAWLRTVPPSQITLYGDPAMRSRDAKHGSWEKSFAAETMRLRERAGLGEIPLTVTLPWEPVYRRNNYKDRRIGLREALQFSEFSLTDGAQSLRHAISLTRFQEDTEKRVTAPGHIHDRFYHKVSAAEFGMLVETLQMTDSEIKQQALANLKQPKGSKRKVHNNLHGRSRYQRQKTSSLLEVA